MRKYLVVAMLMLALATPAFADAQINGSTVTIASVVTPPEAIQPSIMIGIGSAELSYYMNPDVETTSISGINLLEDGQFTFALMTSEEVRIPKGTFRSYMDIEVTAEGFHLYDYNYTGFLEGSSMDETKIKEKDAVPLLSTSPRIDIAEFYGNNENVTVTYVEGQENKISVIFNEGVTKSDLILGTFTVAWKGQSPLETGIYKAKVSVVYSTP